MTRILLRSPKLPWDAISAEETFRRNLIGDNSGNLIFLHATHRILSARGNQIDPGGFSLGPRDAADANERYDVYVLPLANAFRRGYEHILKRLTRFIEQLTIPVVILGVGAQSNERYELDGLKPIEPSVRSFVTAVLERAPSIGVRGELTEAYLRGLGFRDVEVIGCPSMFIHGPDLQVVKGAPALDRGSRISINVSPYVTGMGEVVMHHVERYPKVTYVAQDLRTLGLMLRGEPKADAGQASDLPLHVSHPLFRSNHVRFYLDAWPWIADLADFDFSFGTRIHGNIAALLAGTPAYVFAHDSRTLELARYFEIPHRLMSEVPADIDARDLYAEADYSRLHAGHAGRLATFLAYLTRHGLRHVFAEGESPAAFDARLAASQLPGAVEVPAWIARPRGIAAGTRRLKRAISRRARRLTR